MNKKAVVAMPGCLLMASLEKHFTRELANVPTPEAVETYESADDEVEPAPAGIAPSTEDGS